MKLKDARLKPQKQFFSINEFLKYVFAFTLIINMRTVYVQTPQLKNFNNYIIFIMGLTVILYIILKRNFENKSLKKGLMIASAFLIYLSIFYIVTPIKNDTTVKIMLEVPIIIIYCFLIEENLNDTMKKMTNILFFIAIISLFFWINGSLLKITHATGTWITDWGTYKAINSYYNIYFETQSIVVSGIGSIIRNSAIFVEAPMCSFMFTIALCTELFLKEKTNKFRCLIFIISIISTISTTGITIMLLGLSLKFINNQKENLKNDKLLVFIKIIMIIFAIIIFFIIIEKLINVKMSSHSGMSRLSDFKNGFKAWLDNPIFGYGFGSRGLLFEYGNYGYSNSIIPILTQGGLYLLLPYLISIIMAIRINLKYDFKKFSFYFLFLIMFVLTIVPFQNLTFYIFISMCKNVRN